MHVADAVAATAQNDLTTAFNFAMNLPSNFPLPANLGGVILTVPGVYTAASSTMIPVGGTFTLNGTATDVYVFQIGSIPSTLTTGTNSVVMLTGGLLPSNVFWQVGSSATLGVNSVFVGTIMAQASITLDTGATLQGRALARTGAVTLDNNTIFDP
jgi:type VI secretion system secreted protein VgrG